MRPKVFVTGISGLLGLNLALQARERFQVSGVYLAHPVCPDGLDAMPLDLRCKAALHEVLARISPDVIVHTAGLTNVEACEANPALAAELNVAVARDVAAVAKDVGARLVHVSTDHLFNGSRAWWTEADQPEPLNVYARTKLEAERAVVEECPEALILRTNFYGWGPPGRTSFSDWILEGLEGGRPLTMFTDVFFTPILINDLSDLILTLAARGATGTYHVAGGERVTKFEFAVQMAETFGVREPDIRQASVAGFPFRAVRPRDMSLNCRKLEGVLGVRMPGVRRGLERLRALRAEGWGRAVRAAAGEVPSIVGSPTGG